MARKAKPEHKIVTGLREALVHAKATRANLELRRWCIEQAVRWPAFSPSMQNGPFGHHIGIHEPDLIQRAEKIRAWVVKVTA